MIANHNQPKRLDWLMVLATIVLLAFELVQGASSNCSVGMEQRVRGVNQRDVQVERQLGSNVEMTEKVVGHSEERIPPTAIIAEGSEKLKEAKEYFMREFAGPERLAHLKGLVNYKRFKEWARFVESRFPEGDPKAEEVKMRSILSVYTLYEVYDMVDYGIHGETTKAATEKLGLGLLLKVMADGKLAEFVTDQRIGKTDIEFLKNPLWSAVIEKGTDESKHKVCQALFYELRHVNELKRVELFSEAKGEAATAELATELEMIQLNKWSKAGLTGDYIFKHLGLAKAGKTLLKNPFWETWVTYMTELEGKEAAPSAIIEMLLKRMNRKALAELIDAGKEDGGLTKNRAEFLGQAFASFLENRISKVLGTTSRSSKRQMRESTSNNRQ